MTEPQPIHLQFRWADMPIDRFQARVMQGFRQPYRPWSAVLSVLSWAALFFVILTAYDALSDLRGRGSMPDPGPVILIASFGAAAALGVISLAGRRLQGRMLASIVAAPMRQGETDVRMDASGIEMRGTDMLWHLGWSGIEEVDEIEGFTLLKPSRGEFLPIPHDRLPPGVTPADLDRAIRLWRGVAPF